MIFGFLSACLLITSTRDVPHMFNWIPANSVLSRDPHHYSELESEVGIVMAKLNDESEIFT
jgi:hypothetical protein